MRSLKDFFSKKMKTENIEITVVDDNETLPDFRIINVLVLY